MIIAMLLYILWRRLLDNFTLRFQWFIWKNKSTEKWEEKERGTTYAGIEGLYEFRAKEFSSQTFGHGPKFRWHLGPDRNYCMTFGPGPTFLPLASLKSVIAWKVVTALSSESTIHKNRAINEMNLSPDWNSRNLTARAENSLARNSDLRNRRGRERRIWLMT
jgi:hypothetical protein